MIQRQEFYGFYNEHAKIKMWLEDLFQDDIAISEIWKDIIKSSAVR